MASAPTIVGVVPQDFIIEALGGPTNPTALLDRFPDALYLKSPESHLVRFMYALLGAAGVGTVRQNYLDARLRLEELGLELFDLDAFYGDPLSFGRILEETYDTDMDTGVLSDEEAAIRARDAQYRSRALDFVGGARLGNSPAGMQLVARSGLGHDVEIVEHYKYLYDIHSDLRQGFKSYGRTNSTEEMVVLPRQEVSQSEVQQITVYGHPTDGYVTPVINGYTADDPNFRNIWFNAPAVGDWDRTDPANPVLITPGVQEILEAHPAIGKGNVRVSGGPGPDQPWTVEFIGNLAHRDVPQIEFYTSGDTNPNQTLVGGDPQRTATVTTIQGGVDASDEVYSIPSRDQYHLIQALDRLRPVTTIPTVADSTGRRSPQRIATAFATSEFVQVVRFVTGSPSVKWPARGGLHWIERNVEHQAPRPFGSSSQHYQGFHNIVGVRSYQESALTSPGYAGGDFEDGPSHIGRFGPAQRAAYPVLSNADSDLIFTPDRCLADYPEQPLVTAQQNGTSLIQGIYPVDYAGLSGITQIRYNDEQFWASTERYDGTDYLELDLGVVQAVNFLAFETLRKPVDIDIEYDGLDHAPRRRFIPVVSTNRLHFPDAVSYGAEAGWTYLEFNFGDVNGNPVYTRFIRIGLTRRSTSTPFLQDAMTGRANPWSVEVRNARIGRNVSN